MYKKIILPLLMFLPLFAFGQTAITGKVTDAQNGAPLSAAKVTVIEQNISTQTNAQGQFSLSYLESGDVEISVSLEGYFSQITTAHLTENQELDLGTISLTHDAASESRLDAMMQMSEEQLENEAENSALSGTFSSRTDVYLSQTGYNFSPMRFRTRGYDNTYESTYINGVHFVDAERGGFNYSSLGGMNTATRNRDVVYGLTPNSFAYGNLGTNTNINARASVIAAGHNASVALTNRTYNVRAQYTYGTGILENGWAFAISGIVRWSVGNIPIVDGTFYNSGGLMLMAEKIINDKHSIALTLMGAPTRRAGQSAITKETRDLTSIYYNPSWGYQDGKVRNFRVYKTFDPTATFSHEWKISERQRLRTGIGFHYNFYSNAAMAYNGSHPSPDYYRYMPSFEVNDAGMRDMVTDLWLNDEDTRQMNWNLFYLKNKNNNNDSPDGQAAYAILRRHNNLMESILNSVYQNQINDNLKLTIGIEGKWAEGHHYQTVDDLMGANQMLDFDTYADRDMVGDNSGWSVAPLAQYIQNDVRYPNRIVHEGDIFGYNYAINSKSANAFAQIEYNWRRLYMYVAGKGTYNDFYRHGYMENGRAWYLKYLYDNPSHPDHDHGQDVKSLGKSKTWWFIEPSVKGGFMYNIDNRSRLSFNILAEMRAPLI
ncbi:MAG: carboxypeptidase-like regulatory domain-containing protein, partial [Paludibacter sp.]|nr:carboxypeptidase-like regulatory domain-containing protein [Paludibacter sp.]